MVFQLLGEAVGQARKAAHPHPHGQVLALDVRRADCGHVQLTLDGHLADAGALGRAVADL